jgi:phosphohistidine phosphatase SixA
MTPWRRLFLHAFVAHTWVATLAVASAAASDADLWTRLAGGGHAVLIRHAVTTPGVGDPPGFRVDDCSTQRNLSDEGRREARRLGEALRERGIPVARVLSSPWCRCLETARLAFGAATAAAPLGNLFGRPEARDGQVRELRPMLGEVPTGGNLVLVTHGSTIAAVTGISPDTGEMVIVAPAGGDRFSIAGRLRVR